MKHLTPEQRQAAIKHTATLRAMTPEQRYDHENLNLPPDQKNQIIERLHHMPPALRRLYLQAFKGKSLRAAVTAKCWDCMAWHRSEVHKCPVLACPLYPFRT